jgi:hypothetical protein
LMNVGILIRIPLLRDTKNRLPADYFTAPIGSEPDSLRFLDLRC